MASRKVIFLVIISILTLVIAIALFSLSQKNKKEKEKKVDTLSVWVVGGTSDQYDAIFADFGSYAREYAKTKIDVRVFQDYTQYQRVLLSTLADGKGPDIFMVDAGGDDVLEKKVEPVPDDFVDLADFDKKCEDIFLPLISTKGEKKDLKKYIQGVPLGYETLGIFYNKSLLRTVPKTWNDVATLFETGLGSDIFPINIGMGARYTPQAFDIIAYFLLKNGVTGYENIQSTGLAEYLSYADTKVLPSQNTDTEVPSQERTLRTQKQPLDTENLSTIDLFMRGKIGLVVGYPSLVREIEKAYKRAGNDAVDAIILTDRLPRDSEGKDRINIARYFYLGLSSKTENPVASARLLGYLMTDQVRSKIEEQFPLLISPQRASYDTQKSMSLSKVFARMKMDAFIPNSDDKIQVFHYGLKPSFEKILTEDIDTNNKIDINNITKKIHDSIHCEIIGIEGGSDGGCTGAN